RTKRESDQVNARHDHFRILAVSRDPHDPAPPTQRRCDVQIPITIKRETLRTPKTFEENVSLTIRIDTPDHVGARHCRRRYIQRIIRPKRQVKRRHGRLDLRPGTFLTDAVDAEDRSGAIADIHHPTWIESDSRRDAEITRKRNRFFERIQTVNHTL